MQTFTTVELLRDLKTVTYAASRAPVAITQHRKPRFVLMAIEDYEKLQNGANDTTPELRDLLLESLNRAARRRARDK